MAVDHTTGKLYQGEYTLAVDWGFGDDGRIESEITNLRSGSSRLELDDKDVTVIAFQHNAAELKFSGPTETLVEYSNGTRDTGADVVPIHTGAFLGDPPGADGPFAVVGDWSVTVAGTKVEGAFGADLDPTP